MGDWPRDTTLSRTTITNAGGLGCIAGQNNLASAAGMGSAVWPAANRAIFVAFDVEVPSLAQRMFFNVVTQSGNYDIGLYTESGARLVSVGSTAVPAGGFANVDIADTALAPGTYFMALCVDNTTASFTRTGPAAELLRVCGVQQQALGAVTLPNPATFANPASAYMPLLGVSLVATV